MNKLEPVHPGEILEQEFMLPNDLSSNALARAIGVTPARVNEIVRQRRGITADTALRLARYFDTDAQSWMNLQHDYGLSAWREARSEVRFSPVKPDKEIVMTIRIVFCAFLFAILSGCNQTAAVRSDGVLQETVDRGYPKPIKIVELEFPKEAYEAGKVMSAKVHFKLDADGNPIDMEVISDQLSQLYQDYILAAFRRWKYEKPLPEWKDREYSQPVTFNPTCKINCWAPKYRPGGRTSTINGGRFARPDFCPEGSLVIDYEISESGAAENIQIVESTVPIYMEADTVNTLRNTEFEPLVVDGKPARRTVRLDAAFTGDEPNCEQFIEVPHLKK